MVTALRKHIPILEASSIVKLDDCLKANDPVAIEDMLVKLYYHTNDAIQMLLIEEICRLRDIQLEVDMPVTA